MSGDAVVMMVVAMLVLWGGLILSLLNLRRIPERFTDDQDDDL